MDSMYYLGIYTIAMMVVQIIGTIARSGKSNVEYTGAYRIISVGLMVPMIWFAWNAMQAFR